MLMFCAGAAAGVQAAGDASAAAADADWLRRSHAPGVVKAVGFDDLSEWVQYTWDRDRCNPAYLVEVGGRKAGCRNNAWDSRVFASGKGAVRFDILSRSGQGAGGNMVIPFGDYATSQFGANQEFWVSWRQRMDVRYLGAYKSQGTGFTAFKQIIIGQGDMIDERGRPLPGNACSEAQIVIVSSKAEVGTPYPFGYVECGRYSAFEERLPPGSYAGDPLGSLPLTRQNGRRDRFGLYNCVTHPKQLDKSGCLTYQANQWIAYMVHVKIGPEGTALSSASGRLQPGFTNSMVELFVAYPGRDFELAHRQTGLVLPRGQHYLGGDPFESKSYRGWNPGDGHPAARFGKLWLLPYMTLKDEAEVTEEASTWYDEVIISRCRIAAPGHPLPAQCNPPEIPLPEPVRAVEVHATDSSHASRAEVKPSTETSAVLHGAATTHPAVRGPAAAAGATDGGSTVEIVNDAEPALPRQSQIGAPGSGIPRNGPATLASARWSAVLRDLQPGHWFAIPHSEMVSVQVDACKSPAIMRAYARVAPSEGSCNPDHVMVYSGGAYDSGRHRLLVWGGGHSGYAGNEIYAFDMVAARWTRLTDPSPPTLEYRFDKAAKANLAEDPLWRAQDAPPAPVSVHSYDQLEYLPRQDMLFAAGGSAYSGTGYATALTWLFDLSKTDASGWTQAERMPGKALGLYEYNMATAYDPLTGKVLMRGYSRAGVFDPEKRTWRVGDLRLPTRRLASVGELDPKRRLFVVLSAGPAEVYGVDRDGMLTLPRPLAASGDTAIEKCYSPGLVYDAKVDRMVAWCAQGDVYTLDMDRRVWVRHAAKSSEVPGDPGATQGVRGTFGRFRYMPEYNAYVVVNGPRQNVYIYRLADDQGGFRQ